MIRHFDFTALARYQTGLSFTYRAFYGLCFFLWTGVTEITAQIEESSPVEATWRTVDLSVKGTPPEWAFWEQHLLKFLYPAAMEFVHKYTNSDGTLVWRDEWPGWMDQMMAMKVFTTSPYMQLWVVPWKWTLWRVFFGRA